MANEAMEKERDLEKVGLYESIFPDVKVPKPDKIPEGEGLPKPGENPLDYIRVCQNLLSTW